jgi:hypothetical protein
MNTELPELLLASTQTLTMTFTPALAKRRTTSLDITPDKTKLNGNVPYRPREDKLENITRQNGMTDEELAVYLEDNGYPEHIIAGGAAGLIRRWCEFASEVEQGYRYRLDDYRHDLDIRGVLALTGLEDNAAVQAADDRLRALLTHTGQRVWESTPGEPFWDFGYPRNAGGRLRRDLAAAGLLKVD